MYCVDWMGKNSMNLLFLCFGVFPCEYLTEEVSGNNVSCDLLIAIKLRKVVVITGRVFRGRKYKIPEAIIIEIAEIAP